ncbi:RluA family pseudouridine synthase [Salinispira pacifica]
MAEEIEGGQGIRVIYRGAGLAVIQKPAGAAVQPGKGVGRTVLDMAEPRLGFRPLPVHRLDRDTEGLLVVAQSREAAAEFSRLLNSQQVEKSYLAVCAGTFSRPAGEFDEEISVKGVRKQASTRYRVLRKLGKFTLLELTLGTGRMHQIRIHLAQAGRPVVGDDQHGDFALNRTLKQTHAVRNLMLCAYRLRFPEKERMVTVTAELPSHFRDFLAIYGAADAVPGSGRSSARVAKAPARETRRGGERSRRR